MITFANNLLILKAFVPWRGSVMKARLLNSNQLWLSMHTHLARVTTNTIATLKSSAQRRLPLPLHSLFYKKKKEKKFIFP